MTCNIATCYICVYEDEIRETSMGTQEPPNLDPPHCFVFVGYWHSGLVAAAYPSFVSVPGSGSQRAKFQRFADCFNDGSYINYGWVVYRG